MEFSRLTFEQVHKSSKKFSKITKETYDSLITEVESVNFSKIIEELPKVILEPKFESKDIQYIIQISSELNQIYPNFSKHFKDQLIKELKAVSDSKTDKKIESKVEEEDEKKIQRKKNLYKLLIECYLTGLLTEFNYILELFKKLLSTDKNEIPNLFQILVFLLKSYAESLFGIKSKSIRELIEKGDIEDYTLDYCKNSSDLHKYKKSFQDYFYKVIILNLEEKNKNLQELEKKNMENLTKLDSSNEIQERYQKQRQTYLKFLNQVIDYSECVDCKLPDIANEKFLRVEESKNTLTKVEKINKYDPYTDESEYMFYNKLIDLNEVDPSLVEKLNDLKKDNKDKLPDDEEFLKKKYDNFINLISRCDSKDSCDEAFIEFMKYLNFQRYRKLLPKLFLRGSSKTNYSLLKYYARFTKNITPYYKDLKDELNELLISDFVNGFSSDKLNNMDERYKNLKFIGEMIKFELFPINNVIPSILVKLLENLQSANLELICIFLESCGRFLYLNQTTHLKFNTFLSELKQTANYKLYFDTRTYNSVLNTIQICKPNEHLLKRKVKVRTLEEEYVRYLLFSELTKENVKKIAAILRKMNWGANFVGDDNLSNSNNNVENSSQSLPEGDGDKNTQSKISVKSSNKKHTDYIFKYIYKLLVKGKETQSNLACVLLIHLKDSHPELVNTVILTLIEEIRICLERGLFEDNQHKMLICSILGRMFSYKLISTDLVFFLLYFILIYSPEWIYGNTEFKVDNQFDSDTDFSRILMIVNLLEISGEYLKKERLNEFVHFFQIYILTKKYLPSDIENRVLNCLEFLLGKHLHVYNDFSYAIQDSKMFKGLCDESNEEKVGQSIYNNENEETDHKMKIVKIDDADEFDRKELKKEPLEKDTFNVDQELQKLINEEISKAKKTNATSSLNIEEDLKKNKVKAKGSDIKDGDNKKVFRFITKQNGKAVVTNIIKKDE